MRDLGHSGIFAFQARLGTMPASWARLLALDRELDGVQGDGFGHFWLL